MTRPALNGEQWLASAVSGGLPEPSRPRWQPLRVGIVNLWEYDNAEFWFADGRLVLRGGNGAGKTKVLELTTLMLLRGEIAPSVLDPFGSQHRTMRFNLLPTGEGDDPRRPADSGLGYAWAEFGRRDETGRAHYFVCGLGASARRATGTSGVTTWQFITQLRPGHDFQLSSVDRPLEHKELKKLGGVAVLENATRYRAKLAGELFGLEADGYDNLTQLLKQLRKPKLGERLNPSSLAETLRDALPPLAANEISQLAEGWERLELLRDAVEQSKKAAVQVAQFVRAAWRPWASVVVRRRADQLASTTTELDNATRTRRLEQTRLVRANAEVERVDAELSDGKRHHADRNTELRELLDSQAFQDAVGAATRVESLRSECGSLRDQLGRAERRAGDARRAVGIATSAADAERGNVRSARDNADQCAQQARSTADSAGLLRSVEQHLPGHDLPGHDLPALLAELRVRTERSDHLRRLERIFSNAVHEAEKSAETVKNRQSDVDDAARDEVAAEGGVQAAVDTLRQQIREWARSTAVAGCTDEQVETWCDLVAELTVADPNDNAARRRASPSAAVRTHLDGVGDALRARREELRCRRDPLVREQGTVAAEPARVRAGTEAPPRPPAGWLRRERLDPAAEAAADAGAPLWRCVRPAADLPADQLDLLEATLAAAGLLDARITPDGSLSTADGTELVDVQFYRGDGRVDGDTLAAVLEPTSAGGVPPAVIRSALRGIGWHRSRPSSDQRGAWLAGDGTWRLGPLTGRAEPVQSASYLGATAREAARQRAIEQLESRLRELATRIGSLDGPLDEVARRLSTLDSETHRLPAERPVTDEVARWWERQVLLATCQQRLTLAQEVHHEREKAKDAAWAAFAEYAARHAFPVCELDAIAGALHTYRDALSSLESALDLLRLRESALDTAGQMLAGQQDLLTAAEHECNDLAELARQAEVRLRTAEEALGADHRQQLQRRDELDDTIRELATRIELVRTRLTDARVAATKAEDTLATHEERRRAAELVRDAAFTSWWETFDAGLAQLLGIPEPDRRDAEAAGESTRTARREISVTADAVAEDRAWRRCYAQLNELRHHLLPDRDAQVLDDLEDIDAAAGGATIQRVIILADGATGWQAPHEASDTLAERVREHESTFDAEQQRVLTTLLGSAFIEHLKDRLDYTARTFKEINTQLAAHPTLHGHAVRLKWEAEPTDPDAGAVVTALSQGYHELGPQRQEQVRSFLARKIDAARADASADGVADWKEQLGSALDYRGWLRISLQYRPGAASSWVLFDAAKHAAKSGGEKVVLLSQPLFAAAVVAYNAASERAPRWVWLDEAMTGVDAGIKASFMGLTVSFDLDVMLTAHDEWCNYPTVPAVAVYDLARQQNLPGVDAMPYLWFGGELTPVDMAASPASPGNGKIHAANPLASMTAD
jgi:uncharacterized protein (TIGR02680 family)